MNAARDSAEIAYAKEVYAACATVGFDSAVVKRLKRLIDENIDADAIMAAARQAQLDSIDWAGRPDDPRFGGGR